MNRKLISRIASIIIFLAVLTVLMTAGEKSNIEGLKVSLEKKLSEIRNGKGFPGAAFALRFNNDEGFHFAVGYSDVEKEIAMAPSARMFSGSTGKTFVAAVALMLAEEGRLNLDSPAAAHLGKEEWFNRIPNHSRLTVRNLMNHTGGLPRYVFKPEFWKAVNVQPDRIWKPEELLAFIFDDPPVHPAGEGWAYSDTGYILLGMILERVSGNSFYSELERRILKPFKLSKTSPSLSRNIRNLPQGYTGDGTPPFLLPGKVVSENEYVFNPQWEWTGGGLVTHSSDLAAWAVKLYTGKVLSPGMTDLMLKAVSTETGKPALNGYGLGVQIFGTRFGMIYGHSGVFPGYQTQLAYVPELGCGLAIQVNADPFSKRIKGSLLKYLMEMLPVIKQYGRSH